MRRLTVVTLALAICGCSVAPVAAPSPTASPAPTPTTPVITASPALTPPVPTTTAPATPFSTPTPITDLAQVFRPVSTGWRPSGTTILVATADARGNSLLVGVPLGLNGPSSPPVSILSFTSSAWDIRPDGGAIAVTVATDRGARVAMLNLGASLGAWVTEPDPPMPLAMPVWSKDGAWLYYGTGGLAASNNFTGTVHRIRPDGSGHSEIATVERFGGLQRLTPDGRLLIWSRLQEGGSAEILDVTTGVNRHVGDVTGIASVRARQPRFLLTVGGCCAGYPGGSLALWDDTTLTSRTLAAAQTNAPRVGWGAAAWDPTGTRIVAARFDDATPSLVILDPETGAFQPIAGTVGAGPVLWLDEGIVFLRYSANGIESELMFLPNAGGAPVSLYKGTNMYRMVVIRP